MKNELFEFINQLYLNFIHNHYALKGDGMNLILSLLPVVHNEQLNRYWYNAIIYISVANILSANSQLLITNKTFHM
ncbi:hypothetical protein J3U21_10710 [Gilliamella sp. B2776]|uniref:hypothetical protein n=1 Tax=unclassified Gilliamella TaxID=2685620 RepID=UPI002269BC09|nr:MULTISPECIES: hypothetical protein [unclassified Gilliamella]MCX8650774.1 hypothetical protein [Gilliamella sp. B2779]MCX8653862.1 hypothetical protein [Gilliamella sp. B2737]MCX8657186.1 hypothetical protein [Gilliamella sp. B2894]MCX8665703.1 hypothetical protein [Gilliamella sp. B2887]MCX8692622.1 hypothetical protein [Gilliamella sp. B2776]